MDRAAAVDCAVPAVSIIKCWNVLSYKISRVLGLIIQIKNSQCLGES